MKTNKNFYKFPDSSCVFLIMPKKQVVLVEQWRSIHNISTLELPGGHIEDGETSEQGALRELKEESGYVLSSVEYLFTLDLDFSISKHKTHIFYSFYDKIIDKKDAQYTLRIFNFKKAIELVKSFKITHAPTVCALLWAFQFKERFFEK